MSIFITRLHGSINAIRFVRFNLDDSEIKLFLGNAFDHITNVEGSHATLTMRGQPTNTATEGDWLMIDTEDKFRVITHESLWDTIEKSKTQVD